MVHTGFEYVIIISIILHRSYTSNTSTDRCTARLHVYAAIALSISRAGSMHSSTRTIMFISGAACFAYVSAY